MEKLIKDCTSFIETSHRPLIVILGPTASGKTDLSVKIAKKLGGEIISTDSRQLYRYMPISTALVTKKEKQGVPHHMTEICDPNNPISLGEYNEMALKIIEEIYERGNIPILAGGTGLYISSIIEGYEIPRFEPNIELREQLEREAKEHGTEFIHQKLQKLDPEASRKIHPNNIPYIIRAIEINLMTGNAKEDKKATKNNFETYLISIDWPREILYDRINKRVDTLFEKGIVDEVKALLAKGYDKKLPAMSSVGVKEIIPYIEEKTTKEESKELLKRNTRRYAKRQMTWFRRYDNVHIYKAN